MAERLGNMRLRMWVNSLRRFIKRVSVRRMKQQVPGNLRP